MTEDRWCTRCSANKLYGVYDICEVCDLKESAQLADGNAEYWRKNTMDIVEEYARLIELIKVGDDEAIAAVVNQWDRETETTRRMVGWIRGDGG